MEAAILLIGLHLGTAHFGGPAAGGLRDFNPGIYLQAPSGLTAGIFRNSHGSVSAYGAWTWSTRDGRWALTAGAVTGYPGARVSPLLAPSARWPLADGWAVRLSFLPKPHSQGAAGLHLSIERAM